MDVVVSTYYSSALTMLLNHGGTRIALKSNSTSIHTGQLVTLTATLAAIVSGSGQPTGAVAFKDGSTTIGTAQVENGKAVFTTTHLAAGTRTITANYSGNASFNSHLSGPVAVKVSP